MCFLVFSLLVMVGIVCFWFVVGCFLVCIGYFVSVCKCWSVYWLLLLECGLGVLVFAGALSLARLSGLLCT